VASYLHKVEPQARKLLDYFDENGWCITRWRSRAASSPGGGVVDLVGLSGPFGPERDVATVVFAPIASHQPHWTLLLDDFVRKYDYIGMSWEGAPIELDAR
jgi:hypothetical protein